MLRNVFLKSIREQHHSILWWVVGMSALNVSTLAFYPLIKSASGINEIMQEVGPFMEPFVGGIDDVTSPKGYINSQLFSFMIPLLFIALRGVRDCGRGRAGHARPALIEPARPVAPDRREVRSERRGDDAIGAGNLCRAGRGRADGLHGGQLRSPGRGNRQLRPARDDVWNPSVRAG